MKRTFSILIGFIVLFGSITSVNAANLFDLIYEQIDAQWPESGQLDPEIVKFVQNTFDAQGNIDLSESDIDAALVGDYVKLCNNETRSIALDQCTELANQIKSLVETEYDMQRLGDELLALSNGGEYTVSDEPQSPFSLAPVSLMFSAIWSGTGSKALPWPGDPDGQGDNEYDQALQQVISSVGSGIDADAAIMRFHFGVKRAMREEAAGSNHFEKSDGSLYGEETLAALQQLGDLLQIDEGKTGDENLNEYIVPQIGSDRNILVWIREDDLGLSWEYPVHLPRFSIQLAGDYPQYFGLAEDMEQRMEDGKILSYPYRFTGEALPESPERLESPLCSRLGGRRGYLCRAAVSASLNCAEELQDRSPSDINIVTCDESTNTINPGPSMCEGTPFAGMFDVSNPNIPMNLIGTGSVCVPGTRTTYDSTIISNACFVGYCLRESMSGHTLIPNRNPIAIMEPQSPYQACMRDDPQIGLYAELPPVSSTVLPPYIGHEIVRAFDRAYCEIVGDVHNGVAGYCAYNESDRFRSPFQSYADTISSARIQRNLIEEYQNQILLSADLIGQRYAFDQALPLYTNIAKSMASFVDSITGLFEDLKDAPLTTTACPWNGPPGSSGSYMDWIGNPYSQCEAAPVLPDITE